MISGLVPAEVLVVHAVVLSYGTQTVHGKTRITDEPLLKTAFWVLLGAAGVLYLAVKYANSQLKWFDAIGAVVPVVAFVLWTMLQPVSVFDAVSDFENPGRSGYAALATLVALIAAYFLGVKADDTES